MPRDSAGNYSLPAGYFVQVGDDVLPSQHNPPFEDVRDALTGSLARSGAGGMTGPLNMGNNPIANASGLTGNALAGAGEFRGNASGKLLTTSRAWSEAASVDLGTLSGTVTLDFNSFLGLARGVLGGNVTLGETSNVKPGQTVVLELTQDATGGRTLAIDTDYWSTSGGAAPETEAAANALTVLVATALSDGKVLLAVAAQAVS